VRLFVGVNCFMPAAGAPALDMSTSKSQRFMAQDAVSLLLRTAEQLGDAWWSEHMLPMLSQDEVAAVTLSCKQLRRLCQGGQLALSLDGSGLQETAAIARIPAHFPACIKLELVPRSNDELAFSLPDALDALRG
jgi:hypothetical protein